MRDRETDRQRNRQTEIETQRETVCTTSVTCHIWEKSVGFTMAYGKCNKTRPENKLKTKKKHRDCSLPLYHYQYHRSCPDQVKSDQLCFEYQLAAQMQLMREICSTYVQTCCFDRAQLDGNPCVDKTLNRSLATDLVFSRLSMMVQRDVMLLYYLTPLQTAACNL